MFRKFLWIFNLYIYSQLYSNNYLPKSLLIVVHFITFPSEQEMHLYNAWLPPPVAAQTAAERDSFARVIAAVKSSFRDDDPDSVFSTLKYISVLDLLVPFLIFNFQFQLSLFTFRFYFFPKLLLIFVFICCSFVLVISAVICHCSSTWFREMLNFVSIDFPFFFVFFSHFW